MFLPNFECETNDLNAMKRALFFFLPLALLTLGCREGIEWPGNESGTVADLEELPTLEKTNIPEDDIVNTTFDR